MNRKKGNKFEDKFIKTLNSGAFYFDKADARNAEFLVEIKGTNKKSYRIDTKKLQKIWNDAFDAQKLPIFGIVIENNGIRWLLNIQLKREVI